MKVLGVLVVACVLVATSAGAQTDFVWTGEDRMNVGVAAGTQAPRGAFVTSFGDDVLVLWLDDRSGDDDIYLRHSSDRGATWSPEKRIDTDRIMAAIRNDKKIQGGLQRFVLLEGAGRPTVREDVPEENVREAYESLLS